MNLKFLIEGEEETGSPHLEAAVGSLADRLADDLVLSADGAMWRADLPSVIVASRGLLASDVTVRGAAKDLHSSSSSGEFVTSTYYYDARPDSVAEWNQAKHADRYMDATWELLGDKADYLFGEVDDRAAERPHKHPGRTFPHKLGAQKASDFYGPLRYAPMGDELTLDFAKELVKQEKVGQGETTDMLAVGFSTNERHDHGQSDHAQGAAGVPPQAVGDVLIVQDQFWYLYPDAEEFAAMHGSPYAYDT